MNAADRELKAISRVKFRKWKTPAVSTEQWQERMAEIDLTLKVALHITSLSKSKMVDFIADLDFEQRRETLEALHDLAEKDLPALQELATGANARFFIAYAAYTERGAGAPSSKATDKE
jgi:hypothetical protein